MAGLGLLISSILLGGSAIRCGIDNAKMMSKPFRYLDDGTPVYLDKLCNEHVNGEKIVPKYDYENEKLVYVGNRSGKVYMDPQEESRKRMDRRSDENKQKAIEQGKLAYMRYDFQRKKEITCEVSTGKFIAELEGRKDGTYWKYYLDPNSYSLKSKKEGDPGVQITQEEYDGLNIRCATHYASDLNRETLVWHGKNMFYMPRKEPLVPHDKLPKVPDRD